MVSSHLTPGVGIIQPNQNSLVAYPARYHNSIRAAGSSLKDPGQPGGGGGGRGAGKKFFSFFSNRKCDKYGKSMINIANVNVIHCSNHFVYIHSFNLDNEIDTVIIPTS